LVIQEANAVSTAYDRLDLFEGEVARNLQKRLKEYVSARIELYRMPHDFSLWDGAEVWSQEQQNKIQAFKTEVWKATVAVCPPTNFTPRVRWPCQPLATYLTSRDCVLALPKSIHLTLSM
jgi:hypothetical protein